MANKEEIDFLVWSLWAHIGNRASENKNYSRLISRNVYDECKTILDSWTWDKQEEFEKTHNINFFETYNVKEIAICLKDALTATIDIDTAKDLLELFRAAEDFVAEHNNSNETNKIQQ